ncbi:MAG: tetratricopeptide repeat protein [Proteobacteria bacterium]|nr:tetratricopeptide repeat protein [Pseudomonadota bacterium]
MSRQQFAPCPADGRQKACRRLFSAVLVIAVAVGVSVVTVPASTTADTLWQLPEDRPGSQRQSKASEYRSYMTRADDHAIQAMEVKIARTLRKPRRPRSYHALVEEAVRLYELAAEVKPDQAEPHYRAAEVLHTHVLSQPSGGPTIRDRSQAERALAHWNAFEKLAPLDPRMNSILDRRAIVYTRLATQADIERAIVDYETALSRSSQVDARWLGNLAESYMMVGRIDDAIATYRRALEYSNEPLHGYGLAVALDRDSQGELARQVMWAYSMGDRLRSLDSSSVFFVPQGERYYYSALGYEVMGDLKLAALHYRMFIASGAHPRYQPRAIENLHSVVSRLNDRRRNKASSPALPRGLGL